MTKEQIEALAATRYPISDNVSDNDKDTLEMFRRIYSEGLKKASELLYSEEQMKDMWYDGWKSIAENQKEAEADIKAFLQSLKQQV